MHHSHLFLGLDLGQRQDPSALVIVERSNELTGCRNPVSFELERELSYRLWHAERIALGTPYIEIITRIRRLVKEVTPRFQVLGVPLASGPNKTLVVDASGVGNPVVELLRKAALGCTLAPVLITAWGRPHQGAGGQELVPRRDLLTNLRILLERKLLKIPVGLHDRMALVEELVRVRDRSGSKHDDLVMAAALACWRASGRGRLGPML